MTRERNSNPKSGKAYQKFPILPIRNPKSAIRNRNKPYNRRVFSNRYPYPAAKNQLTLLLERKRQEGAPILDLTLSNPTQAELEYPESLIVEALNSPKTLLYEPSPAGLPAAREAVCAYYAGRGLTVDPTEVLLTSSTSEAYAFLFKLLADPGDDFLIPQPSYPLFEFIAVAESVRTRPYPLPFGPSSSRLDADALEAAVTPGTRGILTVSPNNPTGRYTKESEWDILRRTALKHRLPLICDEVFFDYRLDAGVRPFDPLSQEEVLTFVLNGLSKTVGLPQLKLGWIAVKGPHQLKQQALETLENISDTFLSVNTPVQHAAASLLGRRGPLQEQLRRRLQENLETLREMQAGSPASALPVEGGWYAVLRLPRTRTEEQYVLTLLEEGNVLVHPGYFFDFPEEPFLVLSLLPPPRTFRAGLEEILKLKW
jgi:alanine-synthesizing transaminase